jgi:transcriptional regulator with XRE-family HTH domain
MDEFRDRLKIALSNESVNAFAEKSGITEGALRKYLSGSSLPGLDKLVAIADTSHVNIEWLATGIGPMKKDDGDVFETHLLAIIIELLEDQEKETNKILTPLEKAEFINTAYGLYSEADIMSDNIKSLIWDNMKAFHGFLSSLDKVTVTEAGIERARKIIAKEFGKILPKDEAELEAGNFIDSRIQHRYIEKAKSKKRE